MRGTGTHLLCLCTYKQVVLGYTTYDMFASHPHLHALFCPWWDQFRPYDLHDITLLESAFANVDFAPLQEVRGEQCMRRGKGALAEA